MMTLFLKFKFLRKIVIQLFFWNVLFLIGHKPKFYNFFFSLLKLFGIMLIFDLVTNTSFSV